MELDRFWQELAGRVMPLLQRYRRDVVRLETREKPDRTILTDADLAVEQLVTTMIRQLDRNAVIVAEEDRRIAIRTDVLESPEWIWIVDPIDGTAEFIQPDRTEFCSVVCLLQHREPVAAFVLAPELGRGRRPLTITADRLSRTVIVNGSAVTARPTEWPKKVSVTRGRDTPPRSFELALQEAGYSLKTRTTSQTLDMVRTAVDLRPFTDDSLAPFRLFYRANQKVWDGLAGLCLGESVGHRSVDGHGKARLPVAVEILSQSEPKFDVTVMGLAEEVELLMSIDQQERR
jgi:3'(2'), 5'-bisphosphate nucleotidase